MERQIFRDKFEVIINGARSTELISTNIKAQSEMIAIMKQGHISRYLMPGIFLDYIHYAYEKDIFVQR